MFLFPRVQPLVRISAILEHIGRVKTQKPSKKVNFTTTNAILMKLTTVMYLHESVNRKALTARNFCLNLIASLAFGGVFHEKPPKIGSK